MSQADFLTSILRPGDSLLSRPDWYRALSLTERALLSHAGLDLSSAAEASPQKQQALRRLQAWREQRPFARGSFFAERLAQEGLNEEELLLLLGTPPEALRDASLRTAPPPSWLLTLQEIFDERADQAESVAWLAEKVPPAHPLSPFLPLLVYGLHRLEAAIQTLRRQYSSLPFDPVHTLQQLFSPLCEQLLAQLSKALVLEMHCARLQGELQSETSEERFLEFLRLLGRRERMLSFLEEYPVLARQTVLTLEYWIACMGEFLGHLCADWPSLCATFSPAQDPGLLEDIQCGVGDTHRQGRSVLRLTFQSKLQLLYKPRSLAIDVHFQHLLAWLNERGVRSSFQMMTLLDRGSYGWSECVHARSCETREEVARFFQRQGGYLALLYVFNAIDMHLENVIAAGEHPLLVDLEALFHPPVEEDDLTQPFQMGLCSLNASVFRSGLLPCRIWSARDANSGVDLSGIGGQAGQLTPFPVPRWEGAGTDQMHLVRQRVEIPAGQNRPTLAGEEVDVLEYRADLLQGFTEVYRLLQEQRAILEAEILPLFAHDEVRIIFRPTRVYARLLRESFHPDLLRDALERDRFFDRLWREVEVRPALAKVLAAERRDLLQGDIPLFRTFPESTTVFTSANEPLETFFEISSLELVRQRLQLLDEQDLARQRWIIEAALSTLQTDPEQGKGRILELKPTDRRAGREELMQAARALGDRLEALALRNAYGVSWLGVSAIGDNTWSLLPTDIDLYAGASGIALFLSYLGALTGEERYTELARLALNGIRSQLEQQKEPLQPVGMGTFNGLGSVLYLLTHLSVLWRDQSLIQEAQALVERMPAFIEQDTHLDIVSGAAGCILNLLSLYSVHSAQQTLRTACLCGNHLLATAQKMENGVAWKTLPNEQPLGGFAHGTAGIALSLLKLASVSGDQRYQQTALEALAYDRSLYVPGEQNWADLRTFAARRLPTEAAKRGASERQERRTAMVAWCHGAAGIGLGRAAGLQYLDTEQVRQEITIAVQTTLAWGFKDNHSLCHGALGNLDLILTASRALNQPLYREKLAEMTAMVLESFTTCGWVAGVPLGVETPGLMTGLAGIGYELLRLAEPERVPSVLLLEPPYRSLPT